MDEKVVFYPAEVEQGNCEYKLQLANTSQERLVKLTSQLKWRLAEGAGTATYMLGVEDDGTPKGIPVEAMRASLKKVKEMAEIVDSEVVNVEVFKGLEGKIAKVFIKRKVAKSVPAEFRVIFIGPSGVGKTTLIGVLKTNELDDGDGLARMHILKHQHELDQGRTSTLSKHQLKFGIDGTVLIDSDSEQDVPAEIYMDEDGRDGSNSIEGVSSIVEMSDTAGDPRLFKTVIFGTTAMVPDFVALVIDAKTLVAFNEDVDIAPTFTKVSEGDMDIERLTYRERIRMSRHMLRLCLVLELPFALFVTNVDAFGIYDESVRLRVNAGMEKLVATVMPPMAVSPQIFACSNTTRQGIQEIRTFLGSITRLGHPSNTDPLRFYVREAFEILGFDGAIIGGTLESGSVGLEDLVRLGPDEDGDFHHVRIGSIRSTFGFDMNSAEEGQTVTFGVRLVDEEQKADSKETFKTLARRGSVLLAESGDRPKTRGTLEARILTCFDLNEPGVISDVQLAEEKQHQFTLRTRTIKQRVRVSFNNDSQILKISFLDAPEKMPSSEAIILQRGPMVILCKENQ